MAANPFYVDPMADFTKPMQGLSQSINQLGQQKRKDEVKVKAEARFNAAQKAYQEASQSGDYEKISDVMMQYPELQQAFMVSEGIRDKGRADQFNRTIMDVLAAGSPEEAEAAYQSRMKSLVGRNSELSATSYVRYMEDPEAEKLRLRQTLARTGPEESKIYEADLKAQEAAKIDTTVVDGVLVNNQTGEIVFEKAEIPETVSDMDKAKLKKINAEIKKLEAETKKATKDMSKIKAPKALNDAQAKARGFYDRMMGSETELARIEKANPEFKSAAMGERFAAGIPLIGNYTASNEYQQYRQAADDWIRAKLRRESGAVIGADEMDKEYEIYFPQPGDGSEVIDQKERSRKRAELAMKVGAGPMSETTGPTISGGPPGATDNGDGTFTMPDGSIVRRKRG